MTFVLKGARSFRTTDTWCGVRFVPFPSEVQMTRSSMTRFDVTMRELAGKCVGTARVFGIAAALFLIVGAGSAIAEPAAHVRWDILNLLGPNILDPGGYASATANNGARITLTGAGTFVAPSGNAGTSSAVTGGGTWT